MAKYPEKALFELLKSLVTDEKVYALRAPDNIAPPFIIFQRVDTERWRDINGPSGVAQASIQIDCYASEYYETKDLAATVETALDGFSGTLYYGDDSPQDFIEFGGISLQSNSDLLDQEEQDNIFRDTASYLITYNQ